MVSKRHRTTANQLCCRCLARCDPVSKSEGYCPYPTTGIKVVALFLSLHSLVSSVNNSSAVSHTESAYKFSFLRMGNTPRKPTRWFPKIRQPNHRKNFGRLFIGIVYGKTMAVSPNFVFHRRTIFWQMPSFPLVVRRSKNFSSNVCIILHLSGHIVL